MRIADGRIGAERCTLESLRKRVKIKLRMPFSASTLTCKLAPTLKSEIMCQSGDCQMRVKS